MLVFDPNLIAGQVLTGEELCSIFKCSRQGGMLRSHKTNTLVLISNHSDPDVPYHDRWMGPILHYTGMGTQGDQALDWNQNKTLAQSKGIDGLGVFLFEVFEPGHYIYRGQVQLSGMPYQEAQKDQQNNPRIVWVFPLELMDSAAIPLVSEEIIGNIDRERKRRVSKLTDEKLKCRATESPVIPGERNIISKRYDRDPYVAEWAKRRSNGICQLCRSLAPFNNPQGDPYLETHHITPLAQGGTDTIDNTVALCPNCHRKMHVLDIENDRKSLLAIARL